MNFLKFSTVLLGLCVWSWGLVANAAAMTALGDWKTIDDRTGNPKSIIHIEEVDGKLEGKITKSIVTPGAPKPQEFCIKCKGDRKDQPIVGMTILWDLEPIEPGRWGGGKVLDPKTGEIYNCLIKVAADGETLQMRGYILLSWLGRTQTWIRVK